VTPERRTPWLGLALAAIVIGGLAFAAVVAFDRSEPEAELVDVRELEPPPATPPPSIGGMQQALTPMAEESPPPIVEEEREPKPRARIGTMAPPVATGPHGYLHVNSMPWSEVLVDGRRVGNTPIRMTLSPGAHQVTLVSTSTGVRRTQRVQIRSGETSRLIVDLGAPWSY
jgi:hypothetical protein